MEKRRFFAALLFFSMVFGYTYTVSAESGSVPRMPKEELKALLGNPDLIIIDVRLGKDWADSDLKIKGAIREDPEAVEAWGQKYPKDRTFVLY